MGSSFVHPQNKTTMTNKKKFRCSAFGRLMTGAMMPGKRPLTDAQQKELEELESKGSKSKKLQELLEKRDKIYYPELSKGAKSFIEEEFIKDRFGYQHSFTNIYTEKGKEEEQRSIRAVGKFLGYPFATKAPEKRLENDFLVTSGYDWKTKRFVFDQKNVWDPTGLKLFDEEKELGVYEWQIKGYAMLINELEGGSIESGAVIRVLMNPSAELIYRQAKTMFVDKGGDWGDDVPADFYNTVEEMFDFEGKFPNIEDRMRIYPVSITQQDMDLIRLYVGMAQDYYNSLFDAVESVKNNFDMFKNC